MKIIDILKDSVLLLSLATESGALENITEENEVEFLQSNEDINKMFNLIKFSIRELCTNYIPVSTNVKIVTTDKKYSLSSFENFIRVQNVFKDGEMVNFKIINRNIIFNEDGEYEVNYATYPKIESLFDDIDFLQEFSPDAIVFGFCAYYSIAHGMFEEFESFHDKCITKAETLKELKNFEMPVRRWG